MNQRTRETSCFHKVSAFYEGPYPPEAMFACTYVYACVRVCIYVCMCACAFACMYVGLCVCMYVCMYIYTYTYGDRMEVGVGG